MRQSAGRQTRHRVEVSGTHGGSLQRDDTAADEDVVETGFGEVGGVHGATPALERLVGGEEHGATAAMALVDDIEEDVGGVGASCGSG